MVMKELIENIVKSIVDEPDKVAVNELMGESSCVLELRTDPSDVGKVIGKRGRTASAIRVLLNAVSAKESRKYILEIIDNKGSRTK